MQRKVNLGVDDYQKKQTKKAEPNDPVSLLENCILAEPLVVIERQIDWFKKYVLAIHVIT